MDPTPDSVKMTKNLRQDKSWTPGETNNYYSAKGI